MALTREQFDTLYNKGLSVDQIVAFESGKKPSDLSQPQQKQPGFFQNLINDPLKTLIVKPGIRFGQAIGATIAPALGIPQENIQKALNTDVQTPFGGIKVESQKPFGEGGGRQIAGDIAKTASYLYTGGEAGTIANQTLKGQILRGAITGAETGAIGGGLYSFGDAISQAEKDSADVAYQTLFGAGVGAGTGLILGATLPAVSATVGKIKEYRNFATVEEKLMNNNREIFKPTSSQMAKWEQSKVDPIKTFTREFGPEPIPTKNNTLHLDDFIDQTDVRYKAGSEAFNTILRNSPEVVSLSQREVAAITNIERSSLTPTQKIAAKNKIRMEFGAIRDEAVQSGKLLGNDNIPVSYADNFKDRFWAATRYFGPEEASLANEVNRSIGSSFKTGIEDVVTDVNVKNFNKQLQELITLRDFLESRNGKVPGTGGKMLRYTMRIVGGIGGSGGGPVGTLAGSITADQVAQAIASPSARTWLIRRQLAKLSPEVRQSLEQEAQKILEQMYQRRVATLALPAPTNASLVNKGKAIPVVPSNLEYTGKDIAAQTQRPTLSNMNQANPIPKTVPNSQTIKPNPTTPKPKVNTAEVDNPLLSEARKYKSAEDFFNGILDKIAIKTLKSGKKSTLSTEAMALRDALNKSGAGSKEALTDIWNKANKQK